MLNNIGLPGLLLIVVVTTLLFGRGKVSALMGELGSGLRAFKEGLRDRDSEIAERNGPQTAAGKSSGTARPKA